MSVEIATAYVSLVPSAQGLKAAITREMGGAAAPAEAAGGGAGDGFSSGFGSAAKAGMAAAGVMVAAVFAKAFSDAIGQEKAADKMAASLGLSEADSARLGGIAGDLYADAYGDSFGEVTETMGAVFASFGDLGDAELEEMTAQALDLASVFDVDVTRAVSSAGILMKSGLAADADEAFDLMVAGMQNMPAHLREELLEASDEYGQFFAGLGFSGEEAFGMLAMASQDGMYGIDKTGDALKELTIRSTDMSATSIEAYQAAGLSAEDMSARFLAGGETAAGAFDELVTGLLSIEDPVKRSNAAIALFGTPLEDLGVQEIPAFLASLQGVPGGLGEVEGAAERMGDTLNDNTATKIESFKRKGLQALTDFVGGTVIPGIESLAAWLGPRLSAAVATVQPWLEQAGVWLTDMYIKAKPFTDWVQLTLMPALEQMRAAMIERLGAIVAWVKEIWPDVQATIARVMEETKQVVDMVTAAIRWVWDNFGDHIMSAVRIVWDTVLGVVDGGIRMVQGVIETVLALMRGDWGAAWDGVKNIVGGAWDAIVAIVSGGVGLIWQWVSGIGGFLWEQMAKPFETVRDAIRARIDEVVGFVTGLPARLGGIGSAIANAITGSFKSAYNAVANSINAMLPDSVGIGPAKIDLPDNPLPILHNGGIVPGRPGQEVLAILEAGERVVSRRQVAAGVGGGGGGLVPVQIPVVIGEREVARVVTKGLLLDVREAGGAL